MIGKEDAETDVDLWGENLNTTLLRRLLIRGVVLFGLTVPNAVFAEDVFDKISADDFQGLQSMLCVGVDLEQRNAAGDTPVLVAARTGNLDALALLVASGADINVMDPERRDVLNVAITTQNPDLARLALSLGADPQLVTSVYDGGAIIYGSAKGAKEIVEMLIAAGAPVNRVNNLGWTALLEVAVLGDGSDTYVEIARMLLAAGADPSIADRKGRTPADHAIARGHADLARVLGP